MSPTGSSVSCQSPQEPKLATSVEMDRLVSTFWIPAQSMETYKLPEVSAHTSIGLSNPDITESTSPLGRTLRIAPLPVSATRMFPSAFRQTPCGDEKRADAPIALDMPGFGHPATVVTTVRSKDITR